MTPGSVDHRVAFALGSNLGDRLLALRDAAHGLAEHLRDPSVSAVWATPPEGGAAGPGFLNAVLVGWSAMTGREALELACGLEARWGRTRPYAGAPRTLDVDVLFVGAQRVDEPDLRIPHPRWRERSFVGIPLLEVAPDLVDPESGSAVSEVAREAGWDASAFTRVLDAGALLNEEVG